MASTALKQSLACKNFPISKEQKESKLSEFMAQPQNIE